MNLEDELRALGRSAVVPPVADDLSSAVLARVVGRRVRKRLRDRWRTFVAGVLVLIAGAALAPPVRAQVAEWLRIGGVQAEPVGTRPSTAPPPPVAGGHLSLDDAARIAGFKPELPGALGVPTAVEASKGFVATSWRKVRLEQFQSGISPMYIKRYYDGLDYVPEINGWWFRTPHQLELVDKHVVRIAGPTLVWEEGGITFRLEGVDRAKAVQLAVGTS